MLLTLDSDSASDYVAGRSQPLGTEKKLRQEKGAQART